jgi:hypothetical protein
MCRVMEPCGIERFALPKFEVQCEIQSEPLLFVVHHMLQFKAQTNMAFKYITI